MAKVTLKAINARIAVIGAGEMSFKQEMGAVSRELLQYVNENGDIDAVNRLLNALTPMNKEKSIKFFSHFLPYNWNADENRFGKKFGNKEVGEKKGRLMVDFLDDENANIWSWLYDQQEVKAAAKPKEFEAKIEELVKKAITHKSENIPVSAVIRAVIKAGCSLAEIMEALMPGEKAEGEQQQEQAA